MHIINHLRKTINYKRKTKKGFILLLTLIFMTVLIIMAGAMIYMITYEIRDAGSQAEDEDLINLADAGVQRALREIRDEALFGSPTTGIADLRGNTTSGTAGAGMPRIRYYNEDNPKILTMSKDTYVVLSNFDLNYLESTSSAIAGSAIKSVKIGCRYQRSGPGGTDPQLEILYTTDGSFPQAGNSSADISVSSTSYNDPYSSFIVLDITNDRTWRWDYINSSNFQIRLRCYNSSKEINVEYLFLQVTYQIDTLKEKWADGSYAAFPIVMGSGKIQSVSITDEQGKAHLNTASDSLLTNLMTECGITSPLPGAIVANLRTYLAAKATHAFDSVEELQQVTDMSAANYDLIKDYVTVYSFITPNAQRLSGARAPVNINTADCKVLEALYDDALLLGAANAATFAADIIDARTIAPFTCFYTANSAVTTDFYDFVNARAYLTPAQKNIALDNADASPLIPVAEYAGANAVTTEFSYGTAAFKVESLADSDPNPAAQGRRLRVKTLRGNDGSHSFATYMGDTVLSGWRKENYE
ncbi:MAG: type II secretion system protein GspK [Candidatus Omnitrophota bacterium]|nr:type II secretion system protein GspK [Candidatus Omnitrophota bacterium]